MGSSKFILASASPRRREMFERLNAAFDICAADIDETALPDEGPEEYVSRLALEKARKVSAGTTLPVLAADTVVTLDGELLGKPEDERSALAMIRKLQGRTHRVVTGVALVTSSGFSSIVETTEVTLLPLTEEEMLAYVRTGESLDKAGGYAAQGVGSGFISSISGSYTNVVGLPLAQTVSLLKSAGIWKLLLAAE